jgi:RNA polymerase sigma-70 factor (ECF subfamily)
LWWQSRAAYSYAVEINVKEFDADGHVMVNGLFIVRPLSFHEQWFRSLFEAHYQDLLRYAARRLTSLEDAKDVTSEVFAVAWRRRAVIPDGSEQERMWLYGVARRTLANAQRGERRRTLLASRLTSLGEAMTPDHTASDDRSDLDEAYRALAALRPDDREILLLSLWEDLTVAQIASVMGLRAGNVSVRLHRAKGRLRREFLRQVKDHPVGGHVDVRAHGDVASERT